MHLFMKVGGCAGQNTENTLLNDYTFLELLTDRGRYKDNRKECECAKVLLVQLTSIDSLLSLRLGFGLVE